MKDKIMFFNISPKLEKMARAAVLRGLKKIRTFLKVSLPVEMLCLYDPSKNGKEFSTEGGSLNRNSIFLNININLSFSIALLRQLESTTVHEYVHCLRSRAKIRTLLDALINEGLSCYIQTTLYGPPIYLDLDGTRVEDIQKWWHWWRGPYLGKSVEAQTSSAFLGNEGTRQGGYRLGYYIVSSYLDAKNLSPQDLISLSFSEVKKFIPTLFRKKP